MAGTLYLCATPIGNLEDITYRAINVLSSVDLIAAEDTRHSIKLLNHYEIKTPMTSYHEFNKYDKGKYLIGLLEEGKDIALISDAGTPAISDPGEELVIMAYEAGIHVTSVPGASAIIVGLTLSGLSSRRFVFEGFLPKKKKERHKILEELINEPRTIILYESPHRLKQTLDEIERALGNRKVTIARELTKRYETVLRTEVKASIELYSKEDPRGEYVLMIEGKDHKEIEEEKQAMWDSLTLQEHMDLYIEKGMTKKEAMKEVAKDKGVSRRDIYQEINIKQ